MTELEAERELVSLVIGYQMRKARRQRNLSQADLSHGIASQSMISLIESGRQFPQPDVMRLIAERLNDATLRSYADLLSLGEYSVTAIASTNHELLVEVLRAHRGRWHAVHLKIALELCEVFYHKRDFSIIQELCGLILNHSTDEAGTEKVYFYLGSTYLFHHDYENAISWLRRADEKHDQIGDLLRGRLHYNLGYAYCELDLYGDAIWYTKLAVDTFHRLDDYPRYGKALGLLGVIQARLGRMHEAEDSLRLAHGLMDKWGISGTDKARITASLADVYETQGNSVEAEQWSLAAIDLGISSSDFVSICAAYQTLCLVYLAQDEREKAIDAIQSAILSASASQDGRLMFQSHLLATAILRNPEDRMQAASKAYRSAKDGNMALGQALAADVLATLLRDEHPDTAANYQMEALHLYRSGLAGHVLSSTAFRYLPFSVT